MSAGPTAACDSDNADLLEIALRAYVPTRRGPKQMARVAITPIRLDPHFRLRDHDGRGAKL